MATHYILDQRVRIFQRPDSSVWQAQTRFEGKKFRISTKTDSLKQAKDFAEDWYFELRGHSRTGQLVTEPVFREVAQDFMDAYAINTEGEVNPRYVKDQQARLDNHLIPFFGDMGISKVNTGEIDKYRQMRRTPVDGHKPPAKSTLHHEIVTLRLVVKHALRNNLIDHLPDFSDPHHRNGKIAHRAWFSPEEYKALYTHTRQRAKEAQGLNWQWAAEQIHDYVLFMANTGLRPDEANRLEYRDIAFEGEGEDRILLITVRGKRGVGYCKSTSGAVFPFQRLVQRNQPAPTDLVFPADHKKQFNRVLTDLDLKFDREGNRRSSYSLRHTYICLRLLEGADIYQVAKNCRTSVEMIEKHYAVHLKNTLDAGAINIRSQK